jgi:hypothetical protein
MLQPWREVVERDDHERFARRAGVFAKTAMRALTAIAVLSASRTSDAQSAARPKGADSIAQAVAPPDPSAPPAAPAPAVPGGPPRAEYAEASELAEGLPHDDELSMGAQWLHVVEGSSALRNVETFALRERTLLGSTVAYCAGLDAQVGAGDTGVAYGGTLYALGVGLRGARASFVALCGGAGGDGVSGSVPGAARFPAEVSAGLSLGPIRPILWARASWVAGAAERQHGSRSVYAFDELEAGLSIRLGAQTRYWMGTSAGHGPALGVTYRELLGLRAVGAVLSFDLSGAR